MARRNDRPPRSAVTDSRPVPAAKINRVDVHVGGRVRRTRMFRGYTRDELARANGVGEPLLQAYERGASRIEAHSLADIARVLDVQPSFLLLRLPSDLRHPRIVVDDAPVPRSRALTGRGSEAVRMN